MKALSKRTEYADRNAARMRFAVVTADANARKDMKEVRVIRSVRRVHMQTEMYVYVLKDIRSAITENV
jgi:hypothetical protein